MAKKVASKPASLPAAKPKTFVSPLERAAKRGVLLAKPSSVNTGTASEPAAEAKAVASVKPNAALAAGVIEKAQALKDELKAMTRENRHAALLAVHQSNPTLASCISNGFMTRCDS